jgi:hypothetical protein
VAPVATTGGATTSTMSDSAAAEIDAHLAVLYAQWAQNPPSLEKILADT